MHKLIIMYTGLQPAQLEFNTSEACLETIEMFKRWTDYKVFYVRDDPAYYAKVSEASKK